MAHGPFFIVIVIVIVVGLIAGGFIIVISRVVGIMGFARGFDGFY